MQACPESLFGRTLRPGRTWRGPLEHLERINAQRLCPRVDLARHLHVIADVAFRGSLICNNQDSLLIRHDQDNLRALRNALLGTIGVRACVYATAGPSSAHCSSESQPLIVELCALATPAPVSTLKRTASTYTLILPPRVVLMAPTIKLIPFEMSGRRDSHRERPRTPLGHAFG